MSGNVNSEYNYYDNFKVNFPDEEIGIDRGVKTPWLSSMGEIPFHLDYPKGTMYDILEENALKYPTFIAYEFMGTKVTYKNLVKEINECARALKAIGVEPSEKVTICMPNSPQAVVMFYAVNLVGAIANMVHPLSSETEIENYLIGSGSVVCFTLDIAYGKFENIRNRVPLRTLILTSIKDALSPIKKKGYYLTQGRKVKKVPKDAVITWWNHFILMGNKYKGEYRTVRDKDEPAVMLYSGGTTGTSKAIVLSNYNFNALAKQMIAANPILKPGDKMLSIMPMFHGFGLGVNIHTILMLGGQCILIPRFNPESYAKLIKKYRPNLIAGVPTLYEALLRIKTLNKMDLSCFKAVVSGGDTLSPDLKYRVDGFLKKHNSTVEIREGYGTTECVTGSCLTPLNKYKEGSIGIPLPDMYYKICKVGTNEETEYGEEGEICLTGPTLMLGYYKNEEETKNALHIHDDGYTWLHTGDLGYMDEEGFVYFKQRIKRMIITSGYNVYPTQIEEILDAHEKVHMSCVIGIPDEIKVQKVAAYIILAPGVKPSEELKDDILNYCKKHIAKYAWPKIIEFRNDLPKTLVGKIAYRELEEEVVSKKNI